MVETLMRSLLVVEVEVGGLPGLQLTNRAITDRCGFCPSRSVAELPKSPNTTRPSLPNHHCTTPKSYLSFRTRRS